MRMRKTDVKKWSGILVYIECYQGVIHPVSFELISEAERLAKISGEDIYAAAIGQSMNRVKAQLAGYPFRKLYLYESEDEYYPLLYENIMMQSIKESLPSIVLLGGTYEGKALAPGLAVAFKTGLTADCTALSIGEDGSLIQTRPAFGGNIMANIVTRQSRPQFATVRPGVLKAAGAGTLENMTGAEIILRRVMKGDEGITIQKVEDMGKPDSISEAAVLVVAGRGIRKKEDLSMLKELAGLLGGKSASSRALVEKGWMSQTEQIGLSGNTVNPKYMITCGVSGTVQFMAGMKNTKNIIAINTDPDARIFQIAHYPICQDLYVVLPELIARLKTEKGVDISEI